MSGRPVVITTPHVVGPDALSIGPGPATPADNAAAASRRRCDSGRSRAPRGDLDAYHHGASTEAARNVLRTLIFYDLFDCPIRLDDLPHRTIGGLPDAWVTDPRAMIEADPILARYVRIARGYVFPRTRQPRFERWEQAECMRWQCIRRYETWIRLFCRIPFVRMVAVTGSLSFPMPTKPPDCDLFIVAAANRLWLVVALSRLLFFRILPRLQWVKYGEICPNYSIDERAVTRLPEDLFDSLQVAAMNPVIGRDIHEDLVRSHRGLQRHFPHWRPPAPLFTRRSRPRIVRRLIEGMMRPLPLDRLNRWLFRGLARRFAAARPRVGRERANIAQRISSPWIIDAFDVNDTGLNLSLNQCKVHGHGKRDVLARFDHALRTHPASAAMDLAGWGEGPGPLLDRGRSTAEHCVGPDRQGKRPAWRPGES